MRRHLSRTTSSLEDWDLFGGNPPRLLVTLLYANLNIDYDGIIFEFGRLCI